MTRPAAIILLLLLVAAASTTHAQILLTGRINYPKAPGSSDLAAMKAINCYAQRDASGAEPTAFRSWEMNPQGWYRFSGLPGRYSLLFSTPGHYLRPIVQNNIYTAAGPEIVRPVTPKFDYALFDDSDYDRKAATEYFQTFTPQGDSITSVGFRLVHDGVDGIGPGSQNFLISIHRVGDGTPDKWEQVGPTALAAEVDCGGPKDYAYSVGWDTGMVPVEPGKKYAVRLRAEKDGANFQTHWKEVASVAGCYRIAKDGAAPQKQALWLTVASDADALVIPYNKRVHKQFVALTSSKPKWHQTYVAQGKSLAAVQIYAAVSGAQPSMNRQRVMVRVREGGPSGKLVGRERLAIGNGLYTGDASWGSFGTVFNPGDVPLVPGQTYAIEWESIENYETLHGFVNIKNQVSDGKPGINPYRKHPRDEYEQGTAYLDGRDLGYDIDAQIIEYRDADKDEPLAVAGKNLLVNGDMQQGTPAADDKGRGELTAWKTFAIDPDTVTQYIVDREAPQNRFARVIGGSFNKKKSDGGFVQQVTGLSRGETYRLSGKVRSTWPASDRHQCYVGLDPTGQIDDPKASTIVWSLFPERHGVFLDFASDPIRPTEKGAISVWLRGRTTLTEDYPFRADFDNVTLQQILTSPTERSRR